MLCPHCTDTQLSITDRLGIEIDYCPNCRGIWLDRGELDKLIERSELSSQTSVRQNIPMPNPNTRNYDDRDRDNRRNYDDRDRDDWEYKNGRKRKKSFLGDLFDF